jgi:hypothetical protein
MTFILELIGREIVVSGTCEIAASPITSTGVDADGVVLVKVNLYQLSAGSGHHPTSLHSGRTTTQYQGVTDRVCCEGGKQTRISAVLPRSDGAGEFGEDRCEPMAWVDIHAEFVVSASEVLDERVPGT